MDKRNSSKFSLKQIGLFICFSLTVLLSFDASCKDTAASQYSAAIEETESENLTGEEAFKITAKSLDNHVSLNFSIAPGYILYRDNFKFRTLSGHPINNLDTIFPKAQIKKDEVLGDSKIYTNQLVLNVPLKGFRVEYQGCSEAGFCYAPIAKEILLDANGAIQIKTLDSEQFAQLDTKDPKNGISKEKIENVVLTTTTEKSAEHANPVSTTTEQAVASEKEKPVQSESDYLSDQLKNGTLSTTLLLFLGLGILLSFTPCVLPMVPILANIIVGESAPLSSRRAILLASLYVLSVAVCYAIAGVFAGMMGSYLQVTLQKPAFLIGMSGLLVLFALSQFNLVQLQLPQFVTNSLQNLQAKQKQGSILGTVAMGFLSALIVSPCVTPALVGALSYIGQTGNAILGGLALFALALGMGLPLLLVACIGSRYLPKAGPWMGHIKIITGILLIILAGFFFMRALPKLYASDTSTLISNHFVTIQNKQDLISALQDAKNNQTPIILDVYADWCVSCQKIDKEIFGNQTVLTALQNAKLLRLDLTKQTKETAALQKELGIVGPPTLLFFGSDGAENKHYRLVGSLESEDFIAHVKKFFNMQPK